MFKECPLPTTTINDGRISCTGKDSNEVMHLKCQDEIYVREVGIQVQMNASQMN